MTAAREWTFPSSSSDKTYLTRMSADGMFTCECRGYTFKRGDKPRECTHIKDILKTHGWGRIVRGDHVFAEIDGCDGTVNLPAGMPVNGRVLGYKGRPEAQTVSQATIDRALALADTDRAEPSWQAEEPLPEAIADRPADRQAPLWDAPAADLPPAGSPATPEPMKASGMTEAIWSGSLTDEAFAARFNTGDWVMDEKLDGHRVVVRKRDGQLFTDYKATTLPPQVVEALLKMPDGVVDGELMVPGGISTDVVNLKFRSQLIYVLFDVIEVMGADTMTLPQAERRALLELLVSHCPNSAVVLAPQYEPTLPNVRAIWAKGGEGAILKKKTSTYRPGWRSPEWIKVKRLEHYTVTVTGFEAGSLGPTAIVLFVMDDGVKGRCKNLNNDTLRETAANPEAFVGGRLVIQCQQRIKGKSPRHPMFDHWAGEGE